MPGRTPFHEDRQSESNSGNVGRKCREIREQEKRRGADARPTKRAPGVPRNRRRYAPRSASAGFAFRWTVNLGPDTGGGRILAAPAGEPRVSVGPHHPRAPGVIREFEFGSTPNLAMMAEFVADSCRLRRLICTNPGAGDALSTDSLVRSADSRRDSALRALRRVHARSCGRGRRCPSGLQTPPSATRRRAERGSKRSSGRREKRLQSPARLP